MSECPTGGMADRRSAEAVDASPPQVYGQYCCRGTRANRENALVDRVRDTISNSGYGQPQKPPIVDRYPCPRCGAPAGQPCFSVKGIETRGVAVIHPERIPIEQGPAANRLAEGERVDHNDAVC